MYIPNLFYRYQYGISGVSSDDKYNDVVVSRYYFPERFPKDTCFLGRRGCYFVGQKIANEQIRSDLYLTNRFLSQSNGFGYTIYQYYIDDPESAIITRYGNRIPFPIGVTDVFYE